MLSALHIKDVGPADRMDLEFGERLNVLTGDNGLGKSFVLEVAWWALTGTWVERPVLPQRGKEDSAEIAGKTEVDPSDNLRDGQFRRRFDRVIQQWNDRYGRDGMVGFRDQPHTIVPLPDWLAAQVPILYVRTDTSFSLWDPARFRASTALERGLIRTHLDIQAFHFDAAHLWDGLDQDGKAVCNGLIEDWVTWQLEAQTEKEHPFHLLTRILAGLSHPDEPMKPGKPVRPYLDDVRRFPQSSFPTRRFPSFMHRPA